MVVEYLLAQARTVEMQVYLGRGYALVAEHLLYGAQVGAPSSRCVAKEWRRVCGDMVLAMLKRLRQDVLL